MLLLLLKGECFMLEQEKKDYLQLLSTGKSGRTFESAQSYYAHHAQKAGKLIHHTSSMLSSTVNIVQRVTPTAHDARLPVTLNASVSAFLDSWEKQRSRSLARVSS